MSIQISISDVRESLQVFANGNTANAFTVVKGSKKVFAQKDADILADKSFKLGAFDLPKFVDADEFINAFRAFFADKNITRSAIVGNSAEFTIVLDIYNCKLSPCYSYARIHVYCTVSAATFLQDVAQEQAAQEAAELDQQQAEYEAAQAENEAEEVMPEFVNLEAPPLVHNAEADEFVTNLGTYSFLNGKISYKWGSYTYLCNSRGGVFCQGETIAEDVQSAQDAYEIAREHFYKWEYAQVQSAQQADANAPQAIDVSADITYQTLCTNAKQALVLGETAAEQIQDNTPQEDAGTREPLAKLAHPQVLTNTQIAEFFEQYEKSTGGHYTVSLGGHFWDISITPVPNTRKTVSITGAYSSNGITGSIVIVGRKDNYTLALRYIYECIYKHIQKITQVPIIEPITPHKGIHAIGNSMQEQEDLELIMSREIPCTCVGLSGEVLIGARLIWDYNPKLEQVTYQAFKETNEGLFHIENVYWVIPQTPIQILWQMQAELTRQKSLIKKPNN